MKRFYGIFVLSLFLVPLYAAAAMGGVVKVHVGAFSITGAPKGDELKAALPQLLASRLSSDKVVIVDSSSVAELEVTGNYIGFGRVFSIDVTARDPRGEVVQRSYIQGEGEDDLIPAMGRLARQLGEALAKRDKLQASSADSVVLTAAPPAAPILAPQSPLPAGAGTPQTASRDASGVGDRITSTPPEGSAAAPTSAAGVIRPDRGAKGTLQAAVDRLTGAMVGIAPGRVLANGERELYLAGPKSLRLYRQGASVSQLAEVVFAEGDAVLGVDSADLDGDRVPEAYVTIMNGDTLVSQVWVVKDDGLVRVAENLPYYFRTIALEGGMPRLYAQQIGRDADFYGPVFEVVRTAGKFELTKPVKLPKGGNIYNFNIIADNTGKKLVVLIDDDGHLRVHDETGQILWASGDSYGGSEVYFKRDEQQLQPLSIDRYRWRFVEQRVTVTPSGEIIVPRNSGLFVAGNNRSYKKNSVLAFAWNGAVLNEVWRTKESQNYLADYFYDVKRQELVLLEVVKKEGLFSKGASTISFTKID